MNKSSQTKQTTMFGTYTFPSYEEIMDAKETDLKSLFFSFCSLSCSHRKIFLITPSQTPSA